MFLMGYTLLIGGALLALLSIQTISSGWSGYFMRLCVLFAAATVLPLIHPLSLAHSQPVSAPVFSTPDTGVSLPAIDLDGDGISEVGVVENQRDGSPNELVYHLYMTAKAKYVEIEFGSSNDKEAHGDYNNDGLADLAVVRVIDGKIYWEIRDGESHERSEFIYGSNGDYVISGCDFNGDYATDLAIIRGGLLVYSALGDTAGTVANLAIPEKIKDATCGDLNGDGRDELITLHKEVIHIKKKRKKKNKKKKKRKRKRVVTFVVRAVDTSGKVVLTRSMKKAKALGVIDVDNNGGGEVVVLVSKSSASSQFDVYNLTSEIPIPLHLPSISEFGLTHHLVEATETTREGLLLYTPQDEVLRYRFDSGAIQHLNIDGWLGEKLFKPVHFHKTGVPDIPADPPRNDIPNDPTPPPPPPPGNGSCDQIQSAFDGSGGFLWKRAEHGGLVVLFPGRYRNQFSSVDVVKNGSVKGELYYTGLANPDAEGLRQHWRHHNDPSSFPDDSIVVARRGNQTLCWQIGRASQRND